MTIFVSMALVKCGFIIGVYVLNILHSIFYTNRLLTESSINLWLFILWGFKSSVLDVRKIFRCQTRFLPFKTILIVQNIYSDEFFFTNQTLLKMSKRTLCYRLYYQYLKTIFSVKKSVDDISETWHKMTKI